MRKRDFAGYTEKEGGGWTYEGSVYRLDRGDLRALRRTLLVCAGAAILAFVGAGLLNNAGMRRLFAALCWTGGGLCHALLAGQAIKLFSCQGNLKKPDHDKTMGRARGGAACGGALSLLAALGVLGLPVQGELAFLALQLIQTACAFWALRSLAAHPWREESGKK